MIGFISKTVKVSIQRLRQRGITMVNVLCYSHALVQSKKLFLYEVLQCYSFVIVL